MLKIVHTVVTTAHIPKCDGNNTHYTALVNGKEIDPDECYTTEEYALQQGVEWVEERMDPRWYR